LTRRPIIVKCPLLKRSDWSRVVVKVNRRSVQWCTLSTRSSLNALMVSVKSVSMSPGGMRRARNPALSQPRRRP
jgi:hypothetical protein